MFLLSFTISSLRGQTLYVNNFHLYHQYYYAHAPKNFTTEGAEVFKGDGLIYGGDPVKLGVREKTTVEAPKEKPAKKIAKYSWLDEEAKVK